MTQHRAGGPLARLFLPLLCVLLPLGCSKNQALGPSPMVRVRLLERAAVVKVSASSPALFRTASDNASYRLKLPGGGASIVLSPGGWKVGDKTLGTGILTIQPEAIGSVQINNTAYRGQYRLVPVGPGQFDVVNDVEIEGYLKGVVSKEMLHDWQQEAFNAQAIVARTYVLYEIRTATQGQHFDVNDDQSSQVYGGLPAETAKSRQAVETTAGVVAAYGPAGQERIFHAYFSSCCGGISQNVGDVFGDSNIEPLLAQNNQSLCSASPRFNWGPVTIKKEELTRRFRAWGTARSGPDRSRPEKDIGLITRVDIEATNRFGRPTRFRVHDARGYRYSLTGEEMRTAINAAAPGTTAYSSFFKVINDADSILLVEGHGWGHGVGMCQWCAERRAELGVRHEDIVVAAFPKAKLIRAY